MFCAILRLQCETLDCLTAVAVSPLYMHTQVGCIRIITHKIYSYDQKPYFLNATIVNLIMCEYFETNLKREKLALEPSLTHTDIDDTFKLH